VVNGFIDHLYPPLGTTSNCSAIANVHILQITTAPSKTFSSLLYLQQPFLTTASNSGDSSASRAHVITVRRISRNWTVESQNQSYFTTGGLAPITSPWRQAPWDLRPGTSFFNWALAVIVLCNILPDEKMSLSLMHIVTCSSIATNKCGFRIWWLDSFIISSSSLYNLS
jgi:hypothetical protein